MKTIDQERKDLIVLVADSQQKQTVATLLIERHQSLGIRQVPVDINSDILSHPRHDPGVFHEAGDFLSVFAQQYQYALRRIYSMQTDNTTKPTKPVIIYDGECNFCLNGIHRIQNKDQADQFIYTPKQTPDLYEHYPQLEALESKEGMRFIDASGKTYCGADTIYQIYKRLGKYRYITWLYLVPIVRTLMKGAYLIIAKNRSRLSKLDCESETCSVERGLNEN